MTWMLTATGTSIDLRHIIDDDIHLQDIAHHLAQLNRYTGACSRPYSVAEHSLLVCEILEHDGEHDPSVLMAGLMHDAHEAYTADLSQPMKQLIGAAWSSEEARIEYAVHRRFNLLPTFVRARERIRWADLTALSTERRLLMPDAGPTWPVTLTNPPIDWWNFDQRAGFTWLDWRQAFLDRFEELQFAQRRWRFGAGRAPSRRITD